MKKINIIILFFILLTMFLSACSNTSNNSVEKASVTETPEPAKASITEPANITPTDTANSLELLGDTPLGVKILQSSDNQDNSNYIYINAEEGWKAVYESIGMFRENITLYKTNDGGNSWSKLTSTNDENYSIPLEAKSGFIFIDSMQGWLTTEIPQSGFVGLYKTSDGGASWTPQQLKIPEEYSNVEFATYPPVFFTSKDALLLTNSSDDVKEQLVFVTHDCGESWTQIKEKEDDTFQWSYTEQSSNGIASGWNIIFNNKTWNTLNAITWEAR